MFTLLQPIWLYSIAAIAIPFIIHLWNNKKGKTLQVGSILLLQENAGQQTRNFLLKDLLLLLLRCLLIIMTAFLLAKPIWQKQLTLKSEKGWILIEKESLHDAYKYYQLTIDSLLQAGYKFHYFNKGFKPGNPDDELKKSTYNNNEDSVPYWALLKQLNEKIPSALPVYLFTDNKLKRFAGTRPLISMNLKWNTYTAFDTATSSILKSYQTSIDSVRVIIANSTPIATSYSVENIFKNTNSRYGFINNKIKLSASVNDTSTANSSEVDTSTLRIAIYQGQFSTDASYLKAAIEAIQAYTGLKIKVSIINNADDLKKRYDWIFWLSDKAVPWLSASRIFVYEHGKEQQVSSWITKENNFLVNAEAIHLSRVIKNNSITAANVEPLWKDGFGNTVLSLEKTNPYIYRFYSRFNPDWNNLPWSAQFAEMIFELLIKPDSGTKNFDNRIIDTSQLQPEITEDTRLFNNQQLKEETDLSKIFWIAAFIIFCIERYLSLTTIKTGTYA